MIHERKNITASKKGVVAGAGDGGHEGVGAGGTGGGGGATIDWGLRGGWGVG